MKSVFADSGYWIALLDRRDPLHNKALDLSRRLHSQRIKIVTSQLVFGEVMDYFAAAGPNARLQVSAVVSDALADPNIEVITQSGDLFDRARAHYERRVDKEMGICRLQLVCDHGRARDHGGSGTRSPFRASRFHGVAARLKSEPGSTMVAVPLTAACPRNHSQSRNPTSHASTLPHRTPEYEASI